MKGMIVDFTKQAFHAPLGAIGETLLRTLDDDLIVLQMFQHPKKSISMGIDDTRAPLFLDGVAHYEKKGYHVSIRNSGGRSVANDLGVLNFSLIQKSNMNLNEVYQMFCKFLINALKPLNLNIRVGEVSGAYCPGAYDISIDGKKIAGTAQRRIKDNVLVGAYLGVNGDQNRRSHDIKEFYEISQGAIRVDPTKLTTLEQEYGEPLSVDTIINLIQNAFTEMVDELIPFDITKLDPKVMEASKERLSDQNQRYLNLESNVNL